MSRVSFTYEPSKDKNPPVRQIKVILDLSDQE